MPAASPHSAPPAPGVPPFVAALSALQRLKGVPVSTQRLCAGLPGGFTLPGVEDCLKSATEAGVNSRLMQKPSLLDIPAATLPCILLLRAEKDTEQDNTGSQSEGARRAAVLLEIDRERGVALVLYPEADPEQAPEPVSLPLERLAEEYSGEAVFTVQSARPDPRAEKLELLKPRHWFWGVMRDYLPIYRDVAIASFVVNLLTLASPLFIMNVYDRVVPNHATYTLWVLVLGLFVAHLADFLLRNLRSYFVDVAGRNADVVIGSRLMQRVLHMRMEARPESTGGLVNNLREYDQVRDFFGSTTLLALFDLPFLFLFVIIVAYIGGPMVVLVLAALPLMLLFVWLVQIPFQRSVERQFRQNMQKNSLLVEVVAGLETVKSARAQGHMARLWESLVDSASAESARARRLASLANTGTLLITYAINATVIIWGVYRIIDNQMSMGGLIACVILVSRALAPLMQLAAMVTQMQRSRMALRALRTIMEIPQEKTEGQIADAGSLEPEIRMERVSFRYPRTTRQALFNFNLHIRPGDKIGVIGPTGTGKSTLGRLLNGLYQPTEGSISFGGVDIRQIDQADLRGRIGYLPQENYLFYGSVRENIALGCPWLDMRSLVEAAQVAGVDEFVKMHPMGYDMPVGERGMALSGGQRQAVALARLIAQNPDVFILDEPSSNLDMDAEHSLMLRLQEHLRDKSLLIMTHRPSLLNLVSHVIVLREGQVAAAGPRDAILRAAADGTLERAWRGTAAQNQTGDTA